MSDGNVIFGCQAQGRLNQAAKARAKAIIEMVGLSHVAKRRPQELSGGMKQRVNLARALVTEPRLLLLDEPFGALDAQTREVLQDELVRIWQESAMGKSTTAVFVTHDVREAVLLADRVIVFSKSPGRVLEDIRIDLPRPRVSEVRRSQPFTEYEERILGALYGRQQQNGISRQEGGLNMATALSRDNVPVGVEATDTPELRFASARFGWLGRHGSLVFGTIGVLVLLAAWQICAVTGVVDVHISSDPSQVAREEVTLFGNGTIWGRSATRRPRSAGRWRSSSSWAYPWESSSAALPRCAR